MNSTQVRRWQRHPANSATAARRSARLGTAARRSPRLTTAAGALLIAIMLAACAGTGASATHTTSRPSSAATAIKATAPIKATTPIKAANGVPLPADPDRIVSLSSASTEDLFAVGAGRRVVAADEYSTYPPDAPRTRMNGFEPNVEAIAKYRPDLVVISQSVDQIEPQLAALRIPVLYEPAPNNLAGAYAQIAQLGQATGHASKAGLVIAKMQRQVAAIVASVPRQNPPLSVYHELDQSYYSASSQTFLGQLYALLGLRNIADEAAKASVYPQLTSEYIVASNPDLIVLADTVCCGQSQRTVAARPGWRNIAAVRDHAVLAVNDSVASEWGPRVVLFLADVAREVKRIQAQR